MNPHRSLENHRSGMLTALRWLLSSIGIAQLGCAPDDAIDDAVDEQTSDDAPLDKRVVHEGAQVFVNGPGCPLGSVRVGLSHGGTRVTLRFADYLTRVREGIPLVRRECFGSIVVPESDHRSYAIRKVTAAGRASLPEKTSASWLSVASVFGAHPKSGKDSVNSRLLEGPYEDAFAVRDSEEPLKWSECGVRPQIVLTTVVTLQNTLPQVAASVEIDEVVVQLATRACP